MSEYQAFGLGRYYGPGYTDPYLNSMDFPAIQRVIVHQVQERYGKLNERITNVRRQWNERIRDEIRSETGFLRLHGKPNEGVKITISSELPSLYRQVFATIKDPFFLTLLLNQNLIEQTRQGLNFLEDNLLDIQKVSLFSGLDLVSIRKNYTACEELNNMINSFDLAGKITQAEEDPFGAYFIKSGVIEIYWIAIGLGAMLLNVPVEALTIVVLTHELAHAYTHRGEEINGAYWDTGEFAASELSLVEGLAQQYTGVICRKNALIYPDLQVTFNTLLLHQSACYTDFLKWDEYEDRTDGELIRHCMRLSRMRGKATFQEFMTDLERTRKEWYGER